MEGPIRSRRNGGNGTPIIADLGANGTGENYRVTFPGRGAVTITYTPGQETYTDPDNANNQMSLSTNPGNGDWAAILEKAWVARTESNANNTWAQGIKEVLDQGGSPSVVIRALTGNSSHRRSLSWAINSTTADKLALANNGEIVTASETSTADNSHGLVVTGANESHCYTVLGYNASTQMVHLRNPQGPGRNPTDWLDPIWVTGGLGPDHWSTEVRPARGTNGSADFEIRLRDFCNWFHGMDYEY